MKWISTTIKKKHMNKILSGEKTIEYKKPSKFWHKRLQPFVLSSVFLAGFGVEPEPIGINFLCGRKSYKYNVLYVRVNTNKEPMNIDGEKHYFWYEIHLGDRIE